MEQHKYLGKTALNTTKTGITTTPQKVPVEKVTVGSNGIFEVLLMSIVSIAGFYILLRKNKLKQKQSNRFNVFEQFSPPSCKKCRFFNGNSYLQCAVHPVRVGKKEAKDCSDYRQHES